MLHVTCYMLYVICYMLHFTCCMLHGSCYMLHVTCYVLQVTCYMLHVTYYMLYVVLLGHRQLIDQEEVLDSWAGSLESPSEEAVALDEVLEEVVTQGEYLFVIPKQ